MGSKKRKRRQAQQSQPKMPWLAWVIFILAALSLAVPLMTSLHPNLSAYYFRWLTFQVLTELMLAFWLLLAVADARYRPNWRSPVTIGLLVLTAATLLTLPFAVDPWYSFWSRFSRMTGVVNYLHYFSWLFVLLAMAKQVRPVRRLLGVSCLVATGVGLFGLNVWLDKPDKTVLSTLGNPSFFGSYMMLHVFVALYLMFSVKTFGSRVFYFLTLAVSLVSVLLSGSRGAFLVSVLGLVALPLGMLLVSEASRKRKATVVGTVLLLVVLLLGTIAWLRVPSVKSEVGSKLPNSVQRIIYKNFGSDRWQLWSYAVRGGLERPLFGWGNEQYELMFYKLYDPTGNDRLVLNERFADRAHNQYLDVFVASGLVGLLAYLLFLSSLFWSAWLAIRRSESWHDKRTGIFIIVGGGAHAVYSFFMFDTPAALAVAMLWFALAAAYHNSVAGQSAPENPGSPGLAKALAIPILAVVVAVMLACNILPARKVSQLRDASEEVAQSRTHATELYRQAFEGYNPYLHDLRLLGFEKIQVYAENVSLVSKQMEGLLRFMAGEYEDAAAARDYNIRFKLVAAASNRMLGVYDEQALARADEYAQQALAANPNRFGPYVEVAEIALLQGDIDQAITNFELAVERIPAMNRSQHAYMHYRLSCARAMLCEGERSQLKYEAAQGLKHPSNKDARLAIAIGRSCGADPNFAWAADYVDELIQVYPDHPEVLRAAAQIYVANQDANQAIEMLGRLQQRDPMGADQLAEDLGFIKENQ